MMDRPGRMLVACPTCNTVIVTNREGELGLHWAKGQRCPGEGLRFNRIAQYRGELVPGQAVPKLTAQAEGA